MNHHILNLPEFDRLGDVTIVDVPTTCERHGPYIAHQRMLDGEPVLAASPCPVCKAEADAAAAEAAEREAAEQQRQRAIRAGVPVRYAGRGLRDFIVSTQQQRHVLAVCERFALRLRSREPFDSWLVLAGPCGTGKSHLLWALAQVAIAAGHRIACGTAREIARAVRATYSRGAARSELEAVNDLGGAGLLCLDEVGAPGASDHELTLLAEVLARRYADARPVVMTSNLSPEELELHLGQRTWDRVRDVGAVRVLDGASYRGRPAAAA